MDSEVCWVNLYGKVRLKEKEADLQVTVDREKFL